VPLSRYILSGVFFFLLGPSLFWLLYPIGVNLAFIGAELFTHTLRFVIFRKFVFPQTAGFDVTPSRYFISNIPNSLICFASVNFLASHIERLPLTILSAAFSLIVGFILSRLIYYERHRRN
jgi:hypothetical protein